MIMAKYTKYKFVRQYLPEIRMEKVDVCELQQDWIGERGSAVTDIAARGRDKSRKRADWTRELER